MKLTKLVNGGFVMQINTTNTEVLAPQKTPTKTTEEVLKSSREFLLNNQKKPSQRAYDVKIETPSSSTARTIVEKTVASSALQTADNGLKSSEDILKKMQSIVEKATSTSLTTSDREGLQKEYDSLQKDLDKISENTTYNGHKLLDGKFELETNTQKNSRLNRTVEIGSVSAEGLGISKVSLASAEAATEASKKLNAATEAVASDRKALASEQKTLQTEVKNLTEVLDFQKNKGKIDFSQIRKVDDNVDIRELVKKMQEDIMTQAAGLKNSMHMFNNSRIFELLK